MAKVEQDLEGQIESSEQCLSRMLPTTGLGIAWPVSRPGPGLSRAPQGLDGRAGMAGDALSPRGSPALLLRSSRWVSFGLLL